MGASPTPRLARARAAARWLCAWTPRSDIRDRSAPVRRRRRQLFQLLALLNQVPRRRGVHVVEDRRARRRRERLDLVHRGGDLRGQLVFEALIRRVVEEPLVDQVLAQAIERVALLPLLDLGV